MFNKRILALRGLKQWEECSTVDTVEDTSSKIGGNMLSERFDIMYNYARKTFLQPFFVA